MDDAGADGASAATAALQRLLPKRVAVECGEGDHGTKASGAVVSTRLADFRGGRECARRALAQLGEPAADIPAGSGGQPMWPPGFTGSISHCPGLRAAAAARLDVLQSLGIDVELNRPLSADVGATIMSDDEVASIRWLAWRYTTVSWSTVLWSAKESVFKAWYPLSQRWVDYTGCELTIDPDRGWFWARVRQPSGAGIGKPDSVTLSGRWTIAGRHIITAVSVPSLRDTPLRR